MLTLRFGSRNTALLIICHCVKDMAEFWVSYLLIDVLLNCRLLMLQLQLLLPTVILCV